MIPISGRPHGLYHESDADLARRVRRLAEFFDAASIASLTGLALADVERVLAVLGPERVDVQADGGSSGSP